MVFRATYLLTAMMTSFWSLILQADSYRTIEQGKEDSGYEAMTTVACPRAPRELAKTISDAMLHAAQEHAIEPALLFAVMQQESRCVPGAKSRKGAAGLMQLHPVTAKELGVRDPYAVRENIRGGASYLASMLRQFDGQLPLALAAYNAGPGAVKRYGKIPPYKETQTYVKTVMKSYRQYSGWKGLKT